MRRLALCVAVVWLIAAALWGGAGAGARPATTADGIGPGADAGDAGVFIHVPAAARRAQPAQPVQVLVAIHGMGGNGAQFGGRFVADAEQHGWIVVAPTFPYRDPKQPDLVLQDMQAFLPQLQALLDSVPQRTGVRTRERVLLYGHSRGGQVAHRFATVYPERVLGAVVLSAGSYTLPRRALPVNGRPEPLPLPYGVADLGSRFGRDFNPEAFRRVPFRVEVGGQDTNPQDTPRAWDPYLGRTRVERARTYTETLRQMGAPANLAIYPGAGHEITPQMHDDAIAFLAAVAAGSGPPYGSGLSRGALMFGAGADAGR